MVVWFAAAVSLISSPHGWVCLCVGCSSLEMQGHTCRWTNMYIHVPWEVYIPACVVGILISLFDCAQIKFPYNCNIKYSEFCRLRTILAPMIDGWIYWEQSCCREIHYFSFLTFFTICYYTITWKNEIVFKNLIFLLRRNSLFWPSRPTAIKPTPPTSCNFNQACYPRVYLLKYSFFFGPI